MTGRDDLGDHRRRRREGAGRQRDRREGIGDRVGATGDDRQAARRLVGAGLRERAADRAGWRNSSLASRLPRWILSAGNREAVRKGLARLRETAAEDGSS